MEPLILIGLGLVVGVVLFVIGLLEGPQEAVETAAEKLTRVQTRRDEITPDATRSRQDKELDREFARREETRVRQQRKGTAVPSLSKIVLAIQPLKILEEELLQARSQWRAMELLVASSFLAIITIIFLAFIHFPVGLSLLAGGACFLLPWIYVRALKTAYQRKFEVQLADTLMLMSNGLRAGFSFLQTLEMVSRESQPPVADEFQRMTQEVTFGVPVNQALENMAARVKSPDLDLVVTAVLIQREVGSSLAEILEVISGVISERLRIRGDIRTLTAQGRLTGMVLGFMPMSLGFILHLVGRAMTPNEPSFVQPLFTSPAGIAMSCVALGMQVVGFMVIMKIVSIKV